LPKRKGGGGLAAATAAAAAAAAADAARGCEEWPSSESEMDMEEPKDLSKSAGRSSWSE
jgi:hypothetical protein